MPALSCHVCCSTADSPSSPLTQIRANGLRRIQLPSDGSAEAGGVATDGAKGEDAREAMDVEHSEEESDVDEGLRGTKLDALVAALRDTSDHPKVSGDPPPTP